ncbi:MAG: extracellular solute-binding protein [Geminicoccaceae bacterium]|nr:extracellular solute-binding protein [Geminicoccaceae bacterium]
MRDRRARAGAALIALVLGAMPPAAGAAEEVGPVHGVAMHGSPALPPDFAHLPYADPNAPKGGRLTLAAIGTFDNLNPFILKGNDAAGSGLPFESLTVQNLDEAFAEYGLLAETIEMPADRSWVAFTLRPEARWHDGRPVTVEDVAFSLEILKSKGEPFYRAYYANVLRAEAAGERRVRFVFDGTINRELPLIVGQMPILPKHYWEGREFDKTTLEPPLASGAYRVKSVDPGRSITYERVPDYWGANVPVMRGRYNYDEVRYVYFRDPNVALEALKAGEFDLRIENSSRFWATGYTGPAAERGLIKREAIPREGGAGMQGFVYNLRRPIFQNRALREALNYAFDFEWTRKNLFYDNYFRTESYFPNSELAARGPISEAERALLEPFRDRLPREVFEKVYEAPKTDGSGNLRENLRRAFEILKAGGYEVRQGKLVELASGRPVTFEILLDQGGLFERIVGPFVKNLERLGVEARIRAVDDAQYQRRLEDFDFDMVVAVFPQSLSPGNEQRNFWGSAAARQSGSRNLIGIEDPVVDFLIDKIIQAPDREALITACRALDRVLIWGHYVIPHWHNRETWIAAWDKFARAPKNPRYGIDIFSWWIDPAKERALAEARRAAGLVTR